MDFAKGRRRGWVLRLLEGRERGAAELAWDEPTEALIAVGACSAGGRHYGRRANPMKWKRIIFAAVLVPVGVLAFVNVRDYRRYKFITELERHVTPEQFAAMARVCEGTGRPAGDDVRKMRSSPEFTVLDPIAVYALARGLLVELYDCGETRAILLIEVSTRNQCAELSYDFFGNSKWREVWLRSSEVEAPFRPKDRVLTIRFGGTRCHREYVVTRDTLLVLDRKSGWPEIVARRSLAETDVRKVREAIARIPSDERGKAHKLVDRGEWHVGFHFSEDGARSAQDIVLVDAWCDAVTEVAAAISVLVPPEFPLPQREQIERPDLGWKPKVVPVVDADRTDEPLHYPLWLIWPRIVRLFERQ